MLWPAFFSSASSSILPFLSLIGTLRLLLAPVRSLTMWCRVFILLCPADSQAPDALLSSSSLLSTWQLHFTLQSNIWYSAIACSCFFCILACSHWLFNAFFHQLSPMFVLHPAFSLSPSCSPNHFFCTFSHCLLEQCPLLFNISGLLHLLEPSIEFHLIQSDGCSIL